MSSDTIKNYESGIPLAEDEFSDLDEGCDPFLFSKDGPDGTFCQLSDTNNNEDDTEGGFSSSTENENDCKVLVIGATNSGKTSLIENFLTGKNSENSRTTLCIDISKATIPSPSSDITDDVTGKVTEGQSTPVTFQIYDMAGMRKFQSHNSSYYSNVFAALFVFDATCKISLNYTINWLGDYSNYCRRVNSGPALKVLICNKCDLPNPAMSREELTEFAQKSGMTSCFECSAKSGRNVDTIFAHIADQFVKLRLNAATDPVVGNA